jgi:hypothetical protein
MPKQCAMVLHKTSNFGVHLPDAIKQNCFERQFGKKRGAHKAACDQFPSRTSALLPLASSGRQAALALYAPQPQSLSEAIEGSDCERRT